MSNYQNWINDEIRALVEISDDARAYLAMAMADLHDGPDAAAVIAADFERDYPGFAESITLALDEIDFDDLEIDGRTYDRRYVRRVVLGPLAEYA